MIARALRHRNYRLFFCGQSVSLIGTWLTRVAIGWLVYRLSHSAFLLGVVTFAGLVPAFLLGPLAGVLVDRWNKHRLLVATQIASALQSALLAIPTLLGKVTIPEIIALCIFQGLINAFDIPARQSLIVSMLDDRADLPNAIALNSLMVNGARLIGPACAGFLIAWFGEGGCFAIDAVSYLAVIVTLLMMRISVPRRPKSEQKHILHEIHEGFRYVARSRTISSVIGLLAFVSFVGVPFGTLFPVIVTERLAGGASLLGYLTAASGLGAMVGGLFLARRKGAKGLETVIVGSTLCFGLGLIAFGMSRTLTLSLVMVFVAGLGMMVQMSASNTLLQTVVDENKRGRVMSMFAMAYTGMVPLGSLAAGYFTDRFGAGAVLEWGGVCCALAGGAYLRLAHPDRRVDAAEGEPATSTGH